MEEYNTIMMYGASDDAVYATCGNEIERNSRIRTIDFTTGNYDGEIGKGEDVDGQFTVINGVATFLICGKLNVIARYNRNATWSFEVAMIEEDEDVSWPISMKVFGYGVKLFIDIPVDEFKKPFVHRVK